ncbi:MAG: CDP-alcohol phosphatidyltransferase family protein [Kiritimatiellae bacterium]|nr:CDP-alcohol phosphatidyltransferase family protein [Kiritimatiellia bacterium]
MSRKSLIVNALTFARVPLIFLWAAFAVWEELSAAGTGPSALLAFLASLAMLLSGLTDLWDGRLARRWGVVSTLGKMADPLMDKVFYFVAFPVLVWISAHAGVGSGQTLSLLALTILYLLRDTWVTFLRSVGAMFGADVGAMWLGKVRTALSFPGAGWVYAFLCFRAFAPFQADNALARTAWPLSVLVVEALLAALTLWSLVAYTRAYAPYLKKALES